MTEFWRDQQRARSFGAQVSSYERGRPSYPAEAVEWLVGDARRVADVGAGTGKLTRVLAELGRELVAVEPDAKMRATLQENLPDVEALAGTGEELPLPDASVDAVTYGQAWHWVEPEQGSREAARVLRPGGVLGLIWNVRDDSVGWVAALTAVMLASAGEQMAVLPRPPWSAPFARDEKRVWHWRRDMTRDDVMSMVASRSHVISAPEPERAEIMRGVTRILDEHSELRGRDVIAMPYRTVAWRVTR